VCDLDSEGVASIFKVIWVLVDSADGTPEAAKNDQFPDDLVKTEDSQIHYVVSQMTSQSLFDSRFISYNKNKTPLITPTPSYMYSLCLSFYLF
jgi:hypothetical protein